MRELNFDTGLVNYSINGKCEVAFNPTDSAFVEKLFNAFDVLDKKQESYKEEVEKTIVYVKDRPGHDKRYAIDCTKAKTKLGWNRKMTFEQGLLATVRWYLKNDEWISHIQNGSYKDWINKNYTQMGR